MKTLTLLSALFLCIHISVAQDSNVVTDFLANTSSLENTEIARPIIKFKELAETTAAKKSEFTKENIESLLREARSFKYMVVITGDHTIVKVTHLEQCLNSGSWGTCMPYGEGYISRQGNLEFKQDHLNNIIGIPGSQARVAYFFN